MSPRRIAVTGATGRLGRAVVGAIDAAFGPGAAIPWGRYEFDLDAPATVAGLVHRIRPEAIVHAAAWTDVDGCARDPATARQRNGTATGVLAAACATEGVDLVVVSTNEVFDGRRDDGSGYAATDPPHPVNPYGVSKLEGEILATGAFDELSGDRASDDPRLVIVRTAWLFGPPGRDFPDRILDAADRARSGGQPLRLVADEVGNPTYSDDLAAAIVALLQARMPGIHHVVNSGSTSRATWARAILAAAGLVVATEDVSASTWVRASTPPPRAVLQPTKLPGLGPLRSWQVATEAYMPDLLAIRAARAAGPGSVPAAPGVVG